MLYKRVYACMYVYVMVINLNVSNMIYCVAVWGCGNLLNALKLAFFSNKKIIFIHATDSALFMMFLAITHMLTKLKRLLTFDNCTVPFYGWTITVSVHAKRWCEHPTEKLFRKIIYLVPQSTDLKTRLFFPKAEMKTSSAPWIRGLPGFEPHRYPCICWVTAKSTDNLSKHLNNLFKMTAKQHGPFIILSSEVPQRPSARAALARIYTDSSIWSNLSYI